MDQSGDQIDNSIIDGFKDIDINANSTENLNRIIEPLMDEMKDKCESMVSGTNNNDESIDAIPDPNDLRRDNDSEADEYETRSDDTLRDKTDRNDIKVTVVSTESIESQTTGVLSLHGKSNRPIRPRTEKWGESVGIIDDSGRTKRVISLDELHNYLILETFQRTESKFYCSLINERYPRFFDSTIDYLQRWRMRYNIFVDKVLADKSDESLVHIGELHLYFDLIPKYPKPYYVNNSFYSNPNDSEKPLDIELYQKMKSIFFNFRRSQNIFQLKFPIRGYLFHETDHIFDKFKERHHEIMDESRSVYRKAILRKQRQKSGDSQTSPTTSRGDMSRTDRDFGQSSHDFHQTGQKFPRNQRNYSDMDQGFPSNERQDMQFNQRSFGPSNRGYRGPNRGGRTFSANSTKPLYSKSMSGPVDRQRRRDNENVMEADVTFEDTRERHEKTGTKPKIGRNQRSNRDRKLNEQRMDAFRDDRDIRSKDRRNERSNDSEYRQNRDHNRDQNRDQNRNQFSMKGNHMSYPSTAATGYLYSTDIENSMAYHPSGGQSYKAANNPY